MVRTLSLDRQNTYAELESLVGKTQLHQIERIHIPNDNKIYAKEELQNPTASVFDRVYPFLFRSAEESGLIMPGITPVIEASTGNAGASFAWCAQKLGYTNATVITHADTPKARVRQIESYGANVVFSPAGMWAAGYVHELERRLAVDKIGKGKIGEDFTRMYCLTKIKRDTAKYEGHKSLVDEVLNEIHNIDVFICGVGSGTTISGIGRAIKQRNPSAKIIAIEPEYSPVITEMKKGKIVKIPPHLEMVGIGAAGLPPEKLDIDLSVIDDVTLVNNDDWREGFHLLKEKEGKEVGRSSCAAFKVALDLSQIIRNKNILILFADPAWKYEDTYPYLK